jgi:hypothetical protein
VGKLRLRYGIVRDEAEKPVDEWIRKLDSRKGTAGSWRRDRLGTRILCGVVAVGKCEIAESSGDCRGSMQSRVGTCTAMLRDTSSGKAP